MGKFTSQVFVARKAESMTVPKQGDIIVKTFILKRFFSEESGLQKQGCLWRDHSGGYCCNSGKR